MKIDLDQAVVTFTPENEEEQIKLEQLWRIIIDCNGYASKLTPIGAYIPAEDPTKGAAFYIEGLKERIENDPAAAKTAAFTSIRVEEDNTAYCPNCNKTVALKAGDEIPMCCGKLMTLLD